MSKHKNKTCYQRDHLHRYLIEELSEHEENEIRDHLNECVDCQKEMERVAGGN